MAPCSGDLRRSTVVGYEQAVRRIKAAIGHVPLASLGAVTVEGFYGRLLTSGGRKCAPVSAKTVANTAGVLSVALVDAVRLRLLQHNVGSDARLPRRERKEMTAWTEDEARAFLAAAVSVGARRACSAAIASGQIWISSDRC